MTKACPTVSQPQSSSYQNQHNHNHNLLARRPGTDAHEGEVVEVVETATANTADQHSLVRIHFARVV